ncbi:MAG: MBOAT family protein [Bacteroidetes bacterium]|nr:MBOAT family protein [Bacteroidota bacterium]
MLFTSIPFALFFLIVFILHWIVFNGKPSWQNAVLLISSYIFYGLFGWKFALLLFLISSVNYSLALLIQRSEIKTTRKLFLLTGLILNVGTLVIFKYYNFFIETFSDVISWVGLQPNLLTLNLVLPVGISFYLFLSLSYILDVYQKKLVAVSKAADVMLALSFFPIILAGPIHRPAGLLPQIQKNRSFSFLLATDGLKQILWGLFMKALIADSCAGYVNTIFANTSTYPGSTLAIGIMLFTVQIYADFAGYSNLAIGISKLLGFSIMQNFAYPYYARDIREFWKRWNISLTTWFRDYVFLPIAYSTSRKLKSDNFLWMKSETVIYLVGITITWMLTGLWHGANFTFIIWGVIHGFFLFLYHIGMKPRKKLMSKLGISLNNKIFVFFETCFTLIIVMVSWVFFRADSTSAAFDYLSKIASRSFFAVPRLTQLTGFYTTMAFVLFFFIVEWFGKKDEYGLARLGSRWPKVLRLTMYYAIIVVVFWFSGEQQQFIYFQF